MRDVLIVTHGEDVDGIVSAALLARYLQKTSNLSFRFLSHKNMEKNFISLLAEEQGLGKDLYVLDLSLKPAIEDLVLPKFNQCFRKIVWIDHHDRSIANRGQFEKYGIENYLPQPDEKRICTTGLIFRKYIKNDILAILLACIAQTSDYPASFASLDFLNSEFSKYAEKLQDLIVFMNWERACREIDLDEYLLIHFLVRDLSERIDIFSPSCKNSSLYLEILKEFNERSREARKRLDSSFGELIVSDKDKQRRFLIGRAGGILPPKQTLQKIRREKDLRRWDALIVSFSFPFDSILVFSSPESDFDGADFCRYMKGDGREKDGGFNLPREIAQYEILDFAARSLREYFQNRKKLYKEKNYEKGYDYV